MTIYQVVEITSYWVDDFTDTGYTDYSEINKGYYSTEDKAKERLHALEKANWDDDYGCMGNFKIISHVIDTDVN